MRYLGQPSAVRSFGYCSKGLQAGRIAIPIHNRDGKLVAYCGRIVDDSKINEENPRYKFPPPREREGVVYEFHKMEVVYNAHRIQSPVENLIVVEGSLPSGGFIKWAHWRALLSWDG